MSLVSCSQLMGQLMCSSNTINTAKPEFHSIQKKGGLLHSPATAHRPEEAPGQAPAAPPPSTHQTRCRASQGCTRLQPCQGLLMRTQQWRLPARQQSHTCRPETGGKLIRFVYICTAARLHMGCVALVPQATTTATARCARLLHWLPMSLSLPSESLHMAGPTAVTV
jgi:hypothetical protein